ncbi:MAG: hypothetical protein DRO67_05295 [Candidatus Asgardarchaeum californiense]|nr:MAG: hypothetical protein DRO67_05295 [Candidatus Asgardarchaeum californiense]
MVYSNKFIAVIKCRGKILREFSSNTVRLPFGSDYSILLKNKETCKALVDITIDGKDVLDGNSLILGSNTSMELKGFMKNSIVKNKFRFINKTKEISNYRGDFLEDGLIEIKYRFEKEPTSFLWSTLDYTYPRTTWISSDDTVYTNYCSTDYSSVPLCKSSLSDSGITVPGKVTEQEFTVGSIGEVEMVSHNIIIQLKGEIKSKSKIKRKRITKPITIKTKIKCNTCGRRWKSSLKYCGNCSTYLH